MTTPHLELCLEVAFIGCAFQRGCWTRGAPDPSFFHQQAPQRHLIHRLINHSPSSAPNLLPGLHLQTSTTRFHSGKSWCFHNSCPLPSVFDILAVVFVRPSGSTRSSPVDAFGPPSQPLSSIQFTTSRARYLTSDTRRRPPAATDPRFFARGVRHLC